MTTLDRFDLAAARPAASAGPQDCELRYAVAFRRSTTEEQRVLSMTEDELRARYAELWPAGWRLRQLRGESRADGPRYTATWKRSLRSEISVYGVPLAELTGRYARLWDQGWRLTTVSSHPVRQAAGAFTGYTAVWEPSLTPERQVYDIPLAEFTTRYQELAGQGWRLKSLSIRQDEHEGQPRYTALWQPSVAPEIIAHGLSEVVYQARYERLWVEGWRLKFLAPYLADGYRRITAVWTRSSSAEIQMPATTLAELDARYATLWHQGWRLTVIEPYGN